MIRLTICLLLCLAGCGSDADKKISDTPRFPTDPEKAIAELGEGNAFAAREDWDADNNVL